MRSRVNRTTCARSVDRIDQKLYFVLKAQKTQLLVYTALETDQLKAYQEGFNKVEPNIELKWVRDSTGVITANPAPLKIRTFPLTNTGERCSGTNSFWRAISVRSRWCCCWADGLCLWL